jgi:hypothetical protein
MTIGGGHRLLSVGRTFPGQVLERSYGVEVLLRDRVGVGRPLNRDRVFCQVDRLGFTVPWRFEDDGRVFVAHVDRQGCALILSDQWPAKV